MLHKSFNLKVKTNTAIIKQVSYIIPLTMVTNQPSHQTKPTYQTNQRPNQPTNQPTDRPTNHLTDYSPTNQPTKQLTNQPTKPTDRPTDRPTNQPTNQITIYLSRSMEQSPSWDTNKSSDSQKFPAFYEKERFLYITEQNQ